jgi:hypothetical protein
MVRLRMQLSLSIGCLGFRVLEPLSQVDWPGTCEVARERLPSYLMSLASSSWMRLRWSSAFTLSRAFL